MMSEVKSRAESTLANLKYVGIALASAIAVIVGIGWFQNNFVPANDSNAVAHIFLNEQYSKETTFKWTDNVIASASTTDLAAPFQCPADANQVFTFLSRPGEERKGTQVWLAYGYAAFIDKTTQVLEPNLKPSGLTSGLPGSQATRAKGGNFSLGLACGSDTGITWVAYRTIRVGANATTFTIDDEPTVKAAG